MQTVIQISQKFGIETKMCLVTVDSRCGFGKHRGVLTL